MLNKLSKNNIQHCASFPLFLLLLISQTHSTQHFTQEEIDNQNSLLVACFKGKLETAKFLVERLGTDIECTDSDGNTPLIHMSLDGNADIVLYLLSRGAKTVHVNKLGYSALHCAAVGDHAEVCELLLTAGADVNQKTADDDGTTPLIEACSRNSMNAAKCLVEKGAADIEMTDKLGLTPLIHSAFGGQADFVRYLLSKGAKINRTDAAGASALHYAVFGRALDVCALLVEAGINVKQQVFASGITVLHAAHLVDDLDIVKFLVEKAGADFEVPDGSGRTVLMAASQEGQIGIVNYLLTKKARTDLRDWLGRTAFILALEKGYWNVCKTLTISKN
ncbi:hypothetical protein niasHT_035278 [Heterodera trifolii]|uniref:Ankyrin repeat protein n=1 Tax=Heterodera trifolii TaxID=157864 RepID=A0ABD2IXN4_9BILA